MSLFLRPLFRILYFKSRFMNQDNEEYNLSMLIGRMKERYGVIGYILVFIGAVFIDTPILALLAIPVFFAGAILLIIYYEKKLQNYGKIALLGIIVMCIILAYVAIQFNEYLVLVSRDENESLSLFVWAQIGVITFVTSLVSYFVYLGVKHRKNLDKGDLIPLWLPILILIPLTILWKALAFWTGYWLGG